LQDEQLNCALFLAKSDVTIPQDVINMFLKSFFDMPSATEAADDDVVVAAATVAAAPAVAAQLPALDDYMEMFD